MRRAIARSLQASKQSIPHFYMRMTMNAAPLMEFYRAQKTQYPCTLNDLLVLACARAMREFPAFRSRIEGEELVEFPFSNIGIAVGMDDGLRVPVITGAERLTLRQLAAESRRVIEAAHQGKVAAMGQGLLTISNLGMFGVEEFSAIINPPEAAILAVGALRETVIVSDGAIKAGRVMTVTLSADHRIIDGLLAARFLARLKETLESPDSLRS
jgi:pyruvate dehydrogenase E2 component (dihydrolipoamide acetyltransferase)